MKTHPLEKAIIGEAWTSEVYAVVEQLCDFGSRFAGSESERQACAFIRQAFAEYGLTEVRLASFDYLAWERGSASLSVVAPSRQPLPSTISLVYSPNTPPDGLRAPALWLGLGTEADFAARAGEIPGRFVLASTDSPAGGRWIHRREKYGRAVAGGAAGFLFANHLPGMLAPTGSLQPGQLAEIPGVGLSHEDGFVIRRLLRGGEQVELELHLSNRTRPTQSSHVIGEVRGQRDDEIIVVGAHYDGHDISQAAVDDASGTAEVMALARLFAPLAGRLRRTLRFETYSAEELGVLGSTLYVNAMSEREIQKVHFMLNLDGGALNGGRGLGLQGLEELEPLFSGFAREMGYPLGFKQQVESASDHFPYWMRGVPAAYLYAERPPGLGRGFGHTAADTLDKVDPVELRETVMVAARLLLRLADHPGPIGRRRSREALQGILVAQGLEKPLRAQNKWPFDAEA